MNSASQPAPASICSHDSVARHDPDARSVPRRERIARHAWTDVDLDQLDADG